jgi:hypothetical protein
MISCPSFVSEAAPGSKNTLKDLSGTLDSLEGAANTLVLAVKITAVAQRNGEILDMAPYLKTSQGITRNDVNSAGVMRAF